MTIQSSVYRWYRQGTVAVTNGSTAVTGTTTAWSTNVKAGDGFSLDGATWYEVASVTDNTHLVLASNFGGSTTSGASYAIDRRSLAWQVGSEAAARVLALQQMLQQTLKTTGQPPDTIGSDGAVAYDAAAMVFYTNTGGVWDTGTSFRGSTVLNGSGAPSSGTGNNADFYIDTANNRLYGPKSAGAWGGYVSLVGPTGATGSTGATGATGPANSLSIGTVTTGAAGSSASATITGTAPTQTLSLTIPRGDTGATGAGTGDALTANPLSQFAATTSAQLRGVISDETGTGDLVFATSPTLVTPVLGTPASGTLTNCSGLPVAGVSGLVDALKLENLLINGDFQLNQRGFAGGALAAGVYGYDRWKASGAGCSVSVSGYTVTLTSGTIEQVIETALWRVSSLASTEITVSVDTPSADLTITVGSQTGTITAGSGRKSVTITTAAGATGNVSIKVAKASGSGVTFSRIKAEIGSTATGWQSRTSDMTLARRYFQKSYTLSAAPGTDTAANMMYCKQEAGFSILTRAIPIDAVLIPEMRVAPTLALYSQDGTPNNISLYNDSGTKKVVSLVSGTGTQRFGNFIQTTTDMTSGALYGYHYTAESEL